MPSNEYFSKFKKIVCDLSITNPFYWKGNNNLENITSPVLSNEQRMKGKDDE